MHIVIILNITFACSIQQPEVKGPGLHITEDNIPHIPGLPPGLIPPGPPPGSPPLSPEYVDIDGKPEDGEPMDGEVG